MAERTYRDITDRLKLLQDQVDDFIEKPFDYRLAVRTVERAFERDRENRERRARQAALDARLALLTERELYDRLNSMSDRLDKVMSGLAEGQGTAGQLLSDRQLYENMNGAVAELRQLVQDIRADPRKFLNVRVSLF